MLGSLDLLMTTPATTTEAEYVWQAILALAQSPDSPAARPARNSAAAMRRQLSQWQLAPKMPCVHIAGSKGKGSTALLLSILLQRTGHRVGVFTSPHLSHWSERFQCNAKPVNPQHWLNAVHRLFPPPLDILQGDHERRFFEALTAIAIELFNQQQQTIAIFETGIGGLRDATNAIDSALCCITSIEREHTQQLGTTVQQIAEHKAGIIKSSAPVVIGKLPSSARKVVLQHCQQQQAPSYWLDHDFSIQQSGDALSYKGIFQQFRFRWPACDMRYLQNLAMALACTELTLRHTQQKIDWEAVLPPTPPRLPARMEWFNCRPRMLLDCAHTPQSASHLLETLSVFSAEKRWLIYAAKLGKPFAEVLGLLAPHFQHIALTQAERGFSTTPEQLQNCTEQAHTSTYRDAKTALAQTLQRAKPNDIVVIAGSSYLAGLLRPHLIQLEVEFKCGIVQPTP